MDGCATLSLSHQTQHVPPPPSCTSMGAPVGTTRAQGRATSKDVEWVRAAWIPPVVGPLHLHFLAVQNLPIPPRPLLPPRLSSMGYLAHLPRATPPLALPRHVWFVVCETARPGHNRPAPDPQRDGAFTSTRKDAEDGGGESETMATNRRGSSTASWTRHATTPASSAMLADTRAPRR